VTQEKYKKVTFEFPVEEYIYLKMACAKQGVSMKDFITRATIRSVEDYEDEMDRASIEAAKKDTETHGTISWEEMEKRLGWDKL